MNSLAALLENKGDHAGAQPLLQRALTIREKTLGPDHPETAWSLNELAALLQNKGDNAGAEPLLRRALAIRENVLGPDHPDTATSLNDLAILLDKKGDLTGAEAAFRRAVELGLGGRPFDPSPVDFDAAVQAATCEWEGPTADRFNG